MRAKTPCSTSPQGKRDRFRSPIKTNWALERSFVGAIKTAPDAGVIVIENARLDPRDKFIASAFIERFVTDPEPLLFSTGTGAPVRRRNDFVLGISTNFGTVSRRHHES